MPDDTLDLTRPAFASLLADLDGDSLAQFVANLWEETGHTTIVDGCDVVLDPGAPAERRLRVYPDDRTVLERVLNRTTIPETTEPDALVFGYRGPKDQPDGRPAIIDVDDIYQRLMFGVDRSTCRDLCRTHFDRSVEPAPSPGTRGVEEGIWPTILRSRLGAIDPAPLAVGFAVITLLVLATVVGGGVLNDRGDTVPVNRIAAPDDVTPVGGDISPSTETPTRPPPVQTAALIEQVDDRPLVWNQSAYLEATPTCNRSRWEVIEVFVSILRLTERNESGLESATQFVDPRTGVSPSLLTHEQFDPFDEFDRAHFGDARPVQDPNPSRDRLVRTTIRQRVVLTVNQTELTFEFIIVKRERGPLVGCWQVQSVYQPRVLGPFAAIGRSNASTPPTQPGTETAPSERTAPPTN